MAIKINKKLKASELMHGKVKIPEGDNAEELAAKSIKAAEQLKNLKQGAFARIYNLGSDYVHRIEFMFAQGKSSPYVARLMQEEWQMNTDVRRESLVRQLRRFREQVVLPNLQVIAEVGRAQEEEGETEEKEKVTAIVLIDGSLDPQKRNVLKDLNDLVEVQARRLSKMLKREETAPILLKDVTKNMEVHAKLLHQMSELQFDLGMQTRVAKKHVIDGTLELETAGGHEQRQAYAQSIESQQQAARALQSLNNILHGDALNIEPGAIIEHGEVNELPVKD
jgi:hypothetical protein